MVQPRKATPPSRNDSVAAWCGFALYAFEWNIVYWVFFLIVGLVEDFATWTIPLFLLTFVALVIHLMIKARNMRIRLSTRTPYPVRRVDPHNRNRK